MVNLDTGERIKQIFTMKSTTTDDLVCKSPKTVIFRAILKSLGITRFLTRQSPHHCSQNITSILIQDLLDYLEEKPMKHRIVSQ